MSDQKWYDKKYEPKGWDCPSCGASLPSGIVGIASHWSSCGGKDFHYELLTKIEDKDFGIEELKSLQEKHGI